MIEALDIHVTGIVQGVGFRPFVYRLAQRHLIKGWVRNAVDGVDIHAEGEGKLLDEFTLAVAEEAPAAARVQQVDIKEVPLQDCSAFEILVSQDSQAEKTTLVSPDLATCDDCVAELFDPNNRRYRYPFINCTNCGPRFTIIKNLPYDRAQTSMGGFKMCSVCAEEYEDPINRRFHAQPDACWDCGPQLTAFSVVAGEAGRKAVGFLPNELGEEPDALGASEAIIARGVEVLREGGIVAVKGLGGFHLACDAFNPLALATLRERKKRPGKAFAVMVSSVQEARRYCEVSEEEEALLQSAARPIVLLRKLGNVALAAGLADNLGELGVMLPATPLQHLLMHDFGGMLVMTSGNVHDEPIQIDDDQALQALVGIADFFIGNNRAILNRYDDSVVRMIQAGSAGPAVQFIRRARGYAPLPLALSASAEEGAAAEKDAVEVFATGPEQKNTFTFARKNEAFVSQHMGDMETAETYDAWMAARTTYETLFDLHPTCVACDKHPEYLTGKWAAGQSLPVVAVQHHHAHIAAVMEENGLTGPVCGIAFDGTGYGADGSIWGGEVLLANLQTYERFANVAYFPLPGGAAAIKHPLRCAYGALWAFDLLDHPAALSALAPLEQTADVCGQMIDAGINTPYTSSVGRLFDAAAALLGVCTEPTYEGEGAVLLEAAMGDWVAVQDVVDDRYKVAFTKNTATKESTALDTSVVLLDAAPVFQALLDDKQAGVPVAAIARCFHDALVDAVVTCAQLVQAAYGITTVALGGGVFMNRYLMQQSLAGLEQAGFTVAINKDLPPNDGCVSFGQAVVALNAH